MPDLVIKNATLIDGSIADVQISGSEIVALGANLPGTREIDATGLVALPGFVDLHTHLREPGFEQSETVLTGTQSAALGGYTAVHAMANTSPVADTAGVVEQVMALGQEAGYCDVFPIGAVTVGLAGEHLAELGAMAHSKAKVRVFSDDGNCVSDPLIMRRALEYVKTFDGVIAQHAQDPRLTVAAQMNEGIVSADLGLAGWPAVAEESIIARDVLLAEHVGSRIHVCHLSTKGSVDIIRWAKARGINVTAEVTPHHLVLTEDLVRSYDARYKVNPPLRTAEDVAALRDALIDGTIDIVATDHAPHPTEAKDCEWAAAANGMIGLEAAASIAYEVLIASGKSDWSRFAEVMSLNPAKIARDSGQGQSLQVGSVANIALFDPKTKRPMPLVTASKSTNNPYTGRELLGAVKHTVYRGKTTVENYELVVQ
ncbi:dihydroorotase [Candidatus Rhodoluna planktonica]|uniref:Dihydroorotase n=1 Tax=Candidatus Rhodoluna planktonica TaxID=535712 RepID=A0A1D9DZ14_9MICO|nr:dihydroorotase [Candidatus Rhodoluna planktonica]AOY56058.1 dihydroorotase [Candidatus Rhodoluna planktonica]